MAQTHPSPVIVDEAARKAQVDEVLAEFGGDAHKAIRALLDDQATLVADAEEAVSRGFLRGRFSEGARRPVVDDAV